MRLIEALKVNSNKSIKVIKPFCSKKGLKLLAVQLYDRDQTDEVKALSAAVGVFLGIIPIWGFQTLSAIFLSVVFRLNKALVLIFSHISLPPMLPLIILLSYKAGSFWVSNGNAAIAAPAKISFQNFSAHLLQYIAGSLSLAVVAAIITGALTYATLKLITAVKQYRQTADLRNDFVIAYAEAPEPVEKQ